MTQPLTKKQEAFALAFIKTDSATEAYRAVYGAKNATPKSINEMASRLLKNVKVMSRIDELRAPALVKAGLTVDRVLKEVERVSFFDPRKLYRADGNIKRPDEWDDDTAAAIGGIEVNEEFTGRGEDRELSGYTKKIKIWDKNAALEKAMKHLGLFKEDNKQKATPVVAINIALVE
jgi:phage terminase small subunit